jgi:hypothetical protein
MPRHSLPVQYHELYFDWSRRERVDTTVGSRGRFLPGLRERATARDAESAQRADRIVRRRVDAEIEPLLALGWGLDGPFAAAVRLDRSRHAGLFGTTFRLRGAWVRLRREPAGGPTPPGDPAAGPRP